MKDLMRLMDSLTLRHLDDIQKIRDLKEELNSKLELADFYQEQAENMNIKVHGLETEKLELKREIEKLNQEIKMLNDRRKDYDR